LRVCPLRQEAEALGGGGFDGFAGEGEGVVAGGSPFVEEVGVKRALGVTGFAGDVGGDGAVPIGEVKDLAEAGAAGLAEVGAGGGIDGVGVAGAGDGTEVEGRVVEGMSERDGMEATPLPGVDVVAEAAGEFIKGFAQGAGQGLRVEALVESLEEHGKVDALAQAAGEDGSREFGDPNLKDEGFGGIGGKGGVPGAHAVEDLGFAGGEITGSRLPAAEKLLKGTSREGDDVLLELLEIFDGEFVFGAEHLGNTLVTEWGSPFVGELMGIATGQNIVVGGGDNAFGWIEAAGVLRGWQEA
jgi:hypothetical protein